MVSVSDYGGWFSAIDSDSITSGNCKVICELQANHESVFWIEQLFPDGRRCIFESKLGGDPISWTPSDMSVRNSVHEYGGGCFIVVDGSVIFVTPLGVYKQIGPTSAPQLIFEGGVNRRFADMFFHKDVLYAVEEQHSSQSKLPVNRIAKLSFNGEVNTVVEGADFYAYPRVSPDGRYFSWMEWNLPNMPWDETSIVVRELEKNGKLGKEVTKLSSKGVNFMTPQWNHLSQLHVISDRSNWWNVYSVSLEKSELDQNVHSVNAEIGMPQWQFADCHYATNQHGMLLNISGKLAFKWLNGKFEHLDTPLYTQFRNLSLNSRNVAYCIASGPTRSSSVIQIDIQTKKVSVVRESRDASEIDSMDISVPEKVTFPSGECQVSGWFYPPYSSSFKAPERTLPPVVLLAHGGPTANSSNSLEMKIQYFTSRGFAVFDVNYRGSTGYGTEYRNMLRREWGVVDRDDMISAAKYLIESGRVNAKRVCMMGSSAGGYLLLSTIQHSNLISAASSLYGVSDLMALSEDSHKFEYGYNEQLIGKYPEESHIYESRSPLSRADDLHCPVAFFHGDKDTVVPLSQSIALHEALKAKGTPTVLVIFPGEGHGFRGKTAIRESLVGTYYFFCRVLGIEPPFVKNEIHIENLTASHR